MQTKISKRSRSLCALASLLLLSCGPQDGDEEEPESYDIQTIHEQVIQREEQIEDLEKRSEALKNELQIKNAVEKLGEPEDPCPHSDRANKLDKKHKPPEP